MKYLNILDCDVIDGNGVRVTLFVSGCSHKCKGCHNPESWDSNLGKDFTEDTIEKLITLLDRDYIDGLTLSGGDPLFLSNRLTITNLCKTIKKRLPNKTIWLYTGYNFEEIIGLDIMNYVDVIVDGEFKIDLRDISLAFRGSSNQRVIDVQKTLKSGNIVLYNKED